MKPVALIGQPVGCGMTNEQRDAAIDGAASHGGRERAERHAALADAYFDAEHVVSPGAFLNAMLREAWRETHGNTSRWDRCARAGGVYTLGKEIL